MIDIHQRTRSHNPVESAPLTKRACNARSVRATPVEQLLPGNEPHIRVFRSIALAVGGEEAQVLAALHLCLQQPSARKNGHLTWNKVAYSYLQKAYLPWLTIQRIRYRLRRLVKLGVVEKDYQPAEQLATWAINHERLFELAYGRGSN